MAWDQALLWLAGLCGALVTIGNLASRAWSPYKALGQRVDALEKRVDDHSEKLQDDLNSLKAQEEVNGMILRSMMLLLEHEATGNHAEDLKSMAHELKSFVSGRGGRLK